MSAAEFELVVVYMYTGQMYFESVEQLCYGVYAAERFALDDMKSECLKRLHNVLNENCVNALKVLQLHERFNTREDTQMYRLCEEVILNNYKAILACDALVDNDVDCMVKLLSMNTRHEVNEIDVFRALLKWIRATCVKKGVELNADEFKAVGGDLIYLIRYTLIPVELLATEVLPSGVLSDRCIAMLLEKAYNNDVDVPFCTTPRHNFEEHGATTAVSTTSVMILFHFCELFHNFFK